MVSILRLLFSYGVYHNNGSPPAFNVEGLPLLII
jgi:hypothetical protein